MNILHRYWSECSGDASIRGVQSLCFLVAIVFFCGRNRLFSSYFTLLQIIDPNNLETGENGHVKQQHQGKRHRKSAKNPEGSQELSNDRQQIVVQSVSACFFCVFTALKCSPANVAPSNCSCRRPFGHRVACGLSFNHSRLFEGVYFKCSYFLYCFQLKTTHITVNDVDYIAQRMNLIIRAAMQPTPAAYRLMVDMKSYVGAFKHFESPMAFLGSQTQW